MVFKCDAHLFADTAHGNVAANVRGGAPSVCRHLTKTRLYNHDIHTQEMLNIRTAVYDTTRTLGAGQVNPKGLAPFNFTLKYSAYDINSAVIQ